MGSSDRDDGQARRAGILIAPGYQPGGGRDHARRHDQPHRGDVGRGSQADPGGEIPPDRDPVKVNTARLNTPRAGARAGVIASVRVAPGYPPGARRMPALRPWRRAELTPETPIVPGHHRFRLAGRIRLQGRVRRDAVASSFPEATGPPASPGFSPGSGLDWSRARRPRGSIETPRSRGGAWPRRPS
jgi:hypothetical protein